MSDVVKYLPLGSVVVINGGIKKYVIVSRGLQLKINGEDKYFDYGACVYPTGIVGEQLMYFQHSNIKKIIFEGYSDEEEQLMVENIQDAFEKLELERADVQQLKGITEK